MTSLVHDAGTFADAALQGILAAHTGLTPVHGGVIRAGRRPDQVALVIGGGSGHYPAFAGLVGQGLASGAAYGNIFASPSAGQVYRVARASDTGRGVLLSFGNYAGDVLNFGQAALRLRAEGIDVVEVPVTDDVASAPAAESWRRRGIAGDLVVFKIAGAAAERGLHLPEVAEVAQRANASTRSFGVAFRGCTLPGSDAPLFEVAPGTMAVGLGVHGEPGIAELPLPTVEELSELLVDRLLEEAPPGAGSHAVALLNGLGTAKYEELYVIYASVARRLAAAGLEVMLPEVGELVTSLDMSGVSLSLFWPDELLLDLWADPATTPAYTRPRRSVGRPPAAEPARSWRDERTVNRVHAEIVPAVLAGLAAVEQAVLDGADEFGRLDAIAGDGDHGIGMTRGATAALAAARHSAAEGSGAGSVLAEAAEAWSEHAGGTSGALWGVMLAAAARSVSVESELSARSAVRAAEEALTAVQRLGGAQVGDKTLVDALVPYVSALALHADSAGDLPSALAAAALAAEQAAADTASLRPRVGRARPLAERSLGHPDPGAVSFARIARALAESSAERPATPAS